MCNFLLENELLMEMVFIAASQAWWSQERESMESIQVKYGDIHCIKPWKYPLRTSISDQTEYHDIVVEKVDDALAKNQPFESL